MGFIIFLVVGGIFGCFFSWVARRLQDIKRRIREIEERGAEDKIADLEEEVANLRKEMKIFEDVQ